MSGHSIKLSTSHQIFISVSMLCLKCMCNFSAKIANTICYTSYIKRGEKFSDDFIPIRKLTCWQILYALQPKVVERFMSHLAASALMSMLFINFVLFQMLNRTSICELFM